MESAVAKLVNSPRPDRCHISHPEVSTMSSRYFRWVEKRQRLLRIRKEVWRSKLWGIQLSIVNLTRNRRKSTRSSWKRAKNSKDWRVRASNCWKSITRAKWMSSPDYIQRCSSRATTRSETMTHSNPRFTAMNGIDRASWTWIWVGECCPHFRILIWATLSTKPGKGGVSLRLRYMKYNQKCSNLRNFIPNWASEVSRMASPIIWTPILCKSNTRTCREASLPCLFKWAAAWILIILFNPSLCCISHSKTNTTHSYHRLTTRYYKLNSLWYNRTLSKARTHFWDSLWFSLWATCSLSNNNNPRIFTRVNSHCSHSTLMPRKWPYHLLKPLCSSSITTCNFTSPIPNWLSPLWNWMIWCTPCTLSIWVIKPMPPICRIWISRSYQEALATITLATCRIVKWVTHQ